MGGSRAAGAAASNWGLAGAHSELLADDAQGDVLDDAGRWGQGAGGTARLRCSARSRGAYLAHTDCHPKGQAAAAP